MKPILILVLALFAIFYKADSQVVLNELYASPGAGNHEFFELFNSGTQSTASSVDGFTIVTYFEEGATKGFYVLDLPAMFINPRGFFVGSSALPLNYQGNINSNNSNFSWNDPQLTSKSAYIEKWVMGGSDNSDGNSYYNLATIPANFNDFFYNKSGGGITYSVFIYKNGLLINSFYGGAGGIISQPSFITNMPELKVNSVISGVVNSNFTVKFNQLTNNVAEYVAASDGTDNGFIRKKDGVCGTWVKSSSSVSHNPGSSNGASAGTGTITIGGYIERGNAPATTSLAKYDITDGTADAFPVELQVYTDNGTVPGDLDASDDFIESKTQTAVTDGILTTSFSPMSANILIVAKTAAGCFGQVTLITSGTNATLPVKLVNFNGNIKGDAVNLTWTVDLNETVDRFEIERSSNGTSFEKIGSVTGYGFSGLHIYNFMDLSGLQQKVSYKLKMWDKNQKAEYSQIISFSSSSFSEQSISLMQNPVSDKLNINFVTNEKETVDIRVIDITGSIRTSQKVIVHSGRNILSVPLSTSMMKGLYVVSVSHSKGIFNQRFIRH